jgi:hypothetical protein
MAAALPAEAINPSKNVRRCIVDAYAKPLGWPNL